METLAAMRKIDRGNPDYTHFLNSLARLYEYRDTTIYGMKWATITEDPREVGENPKVSTQPLLDALHPSLSVALRPRFQSSKENLGGEFYAPMLYRRAWWNSPDSEEIRKYKVDRCGSQGSEKMAALGDRSLLEVMNSLGVIDALVSRVLLTEAIALVPVDFSQSRFTAEFYPQVGFGSFSANYAIHSVVESKLSEGAIITCDNKRNPVLEQSGMNMHQFSLSATRHYNIRKTSRRTSQGHFVIVALPIQTDDGGVLVRMGIPFVSKYNLDRFRGVAPSQSSAVGLNGNTSLVDLSIGKGLAVGRYNCIGGNYEYARSANEGVDKGSKKKFNEDMRPEIFHLKIEGIPVEDADKLEKEDFITFARDLDNYYRK